MSELDVSEFADGEKGLIENHQPPTREGAKAPTVSIEEVAIVRPIKVIGFMSAIVGVIVLGLSVAGTSWLKGDDKQEGLWAVCYDDVNETDVINCMENESRIGSLDWMDACRTFSVVAMLAGFAGFVVATVGVTTSQLKMKYCYYTSAVALLILAAIPEFISLIVFAKKFVEENNPKHWSVGWAYIFGWLAVALYLLGAIIFLVDRNAEEIVLCEVSTANEEEGIEDVATDV